MACADTMRLGLRYRLYSASVARDGKHRELRDVKQKDTRGTKNPISTNSARSNRRVCER